MIARAIEEHYVKRWGLPSRRASFTSQRGPDMEVLKWNASSNPEAVALYATIGASATPLRQSDPSHRVEFLVGLLPEEDQVARSLALLAQYPFAESVSV